MKTKSLGHRQIPDFTEDFVAFMVQMILTITKFPRAPFALVPLSKKEEVVYGADAKIESVAPLFLQFKKSFAYPSTSNSKIIKDRKELNLTVDDRVLYFQLREKQKTHADFQHNVLYELRKQLRSTGTGDAIYAAPLFLERIAYLLAVHTTAILRWPFHIFYHEPFFQGTQEIITRTGSIRFQNCPVLSQHIAIPPHAKVASAKHNYSFLETGQQVCFHSPTQIESHLSLGQLIYDFMKFNEGRPARQMTSISDSVNLLASLNRITFGEVGNILESDERSVIGRWIEFGGRLKAIYDIDQYLLIEFKQ